MKGKISSIFTSGIIGIGIGIPVTLVCMSLLGGFNTVIAEFLVWTVASALFGILTGLIFHTDNNLSLPLAVTLHFIGCLTIASAAVMICGYVDSFTVWLSAILPVFVIVYIIVYICCYLAWKKEAKEINRELNQK